MVPIREALNLLGGLFEWGYCEILLLCPDILLLEHGDKFPERTDDVAMVSSLSPVIDIYFMEDFEEAATGPRETYNW
jgi:hypothetical protein